MNGMYLLLGSNLGHRLENLKKAEALLMESGISVLDESSVLETEPWGIKEQNWFLNVVLQIETSLSAPDLLKKVLDIEARMGRVRKEKWGERSIDIDILYYYDKVIKSSHLQLPHPSIPERRFTLMPLNELCPLELHPVLKKTQVELLAECTDPLDCRITDHRL